MKDNRRDFIKKSALLLGSLSLGKTEVLPSAVVPAQEVSTLVLDASVLPSSMSPADIMKFYREMGVLFYTSDNTHYDGGKTKWREQDEKGQWPT